MTDRQLNILVWWVGMPALLGLESLPFLWLFGVIG